MCRVPDCSSPHPEARGWCVALPLSAPLRAGLAIPLIRNRIAHAGHAAPEWFGLEPLHATVAIIPQLRHGSFVIKLKTQTWDSVRLRKITIPEVDGVAGALSCCRRRTTTASVSA